MESIIKIIYTPDYTNELTNYTFERGWGNGYVMLPIGHKYYGVDYSQLHHLEFGQELTYSAMEGNKWVLGFDTAHLGQDKINWNMERVFQTCLKLQKVLEE